MIGKNRYTIFHTNLSIQIFTFAASSYKKLQSFENKNFLNKTSDCRCHLDAPAAITLRYPRSHILVLYASEIIYSVPRNAATTIPTHEAKFITHANDDDRRTSSNGFGAHHGFGALRPRPLSWDQYCRNSPPHETKTADAQCPSGTKPPNDGRRSSQHPETGFLSQAAKESQRIRWLWSFTEQELCVLSVSFVIPPQGFFGSCNVSHSTRMLLRYDWEYKHTKLINSTGSLF